MSLSWQRGSPRAPVGPAPGLDHSLPGIGEVIDSSGVRPRPLTRTIPDQAWEAVGGGTFVDGRLYPDTGERVGDRFVVGSCEDEEAVYWSSYFTLNNWAEWAGATVLCPRAPVLSSTLVRFDEVGRFIAHGYRNPYRAPGVPDWYFFWVRYHSQAKLKAWGRTQGLLPASDLPQGMGGYGADNGLRAEGHTPSPLPSARSSSKVARPWER